MALVADGYTLSIVLTDQAGDDTTRSFELVAADETEAIAATDDILAAMLNVTDAKIKSYTTGIRFIDNAFVLPTGGVQVENQLKVGLTLVGNPNKRGYFTIPAPKDTLFVAASGEGYNQPDFADASLLAYMNLFTATGDASYISDGEVGTVVNPRGTRIHSKNNKG